MIAVQLIINQVCNDWGRTPDGTGGTSRTSRTGGATVAGRARCGTRANEFGEQDCRAGVGGLGGCCGMTKVVRPVVTTRGRMDNGRGTPPNP